MTGTVRWFDNAKGYGFITSDDDKDKDIFVHFSDVDDSLKGLDNRKNLKENQRVEFETIQGSRGPDSLKAIGVRALGD